MAEKIAPKFRKTKTDKWAVMAPVDDLEKALAEGGKIEVLKKSGDWSSFRVASLGKPFEVDGVMMCYGYGPDDDNEGGGSSGGGAGGGRSGDRADGRQGGGGRRPAPDIDLSRSPGRDPSEPLPEYQGGAEDEWAEF